MAFKTINFVDKNMQLLQDNIAAALPADVTSLKINSDANGNKDVSRKSVASIFSGGTLVTLKLTQNQDNLVPHGLNRTPIVWALLGIDTNATIWSPTTSQISNKNSVALNANENYLNLRTSATCNVVVWLN